LRCSAGVEGGMNTVHALQATGQTWLFGKFMFGHLLPKSTKNKEPQGTLYCVNL